MLLAWSICLCASTDQEADMQAIAPFVDTFPSCLIKQVCSFHDCLDRPKNLWALPVEATETGSRDTKHLLNSTPDASSAFPTLILFGHWLRMEHLFFHYELWTALYIASLKKTSDRRMVLSKCHVKQNHGEREGFWLLRRSSGSPRNFNKAREVSWQRISSAFNAKIQSSVQNHLLNQSKLWKYLEWAQLMFLLFFLYL